MTKVEQLLEEVNAKSAELHTVFDEAGEALDMEAVKSIDGDTHEKVAWIRERSDELADLRGDLNEAMEVEKAHKHLEETQTVAEIVEKALRGEPLNALAFPSGVGGDESKGFGDLFVREFYKDGKFKADMKGGEYALEGWDFKTLFQTSAGWAPETTRTGRVVDYATTPIDVLDLFPTNTTAQSAIVYMEETTYTNNAAETAEAGAYPESAYALTEQSSPVRKITHFIPVTDEQLDDVGGAGSYLDNRLRFGLRQRLNGQVLTGDGIAPNLEGILNRTGIQTQAKGADPTPDAVYKAMTKVMTGTGQAIPNATVWNPLDWQDVRLLRTADGIYIWGSPAQAGPATIWGLPVVLSQALTENTALVGDFANFSELSIRKGIEVKISDSHSDYFVNGKQAIRADMRAALQIYRPAAFCTVTGV